MLGRLLKILFAGLIVAFIVGAGQYACGGDPETGKNIDFGQPFPDTGGSL